MKARATLRMLCIDLMMARQRTVRTPTSVEIHGAARSGVIVACLGTWARASEPGGSLETVCLEPFPGEHVGIDGVDGVALVEFGEVAGRDLGADRVEEIGET